MKSLLTILIILFLTSPVLADDWDTVDKTLLGGLIASTTIDCLQTQYIFDNPDQFHETNSIIVEGVDRFGKGFIPVYFVLLTLFDGLVADWLPTDWRKGWLGIRVGGAIDTIHDNYSIGIGFSF